MNLRRREFFILTRPPLPLAATHTRTGRLNTSDNIRHIRQQAESRAQAGNHTDTVPAYSVGMDGDSASTYGYGGSSEGDVHTPYTPSVPSVAEIPAAGLVLLAIAAMPIIVGIAVFVITLIRRWGCRTHQRQCCVICEARSIEHSTASSRGGHVHIELVNADPS